MAYIGHTPAEKYVSLAVQHFSVTATANYTLTNSITSANELALYINNVRQEPGGSYAYTASGTALTLSAATAASDTMYCVYLGKSVGTISPPAGSVSSASIVDGTITNDDLAGSITSAKITSLDATKLTGTVADARFPATLPASSGANLTALPAANLTGTVADARISALTASKLTGALPAISGASLTGITTAPYMAWQSVVTASTITVVAGRGYPINTTSNTCTITLPATASVGDTIKFVDYARKWGTYKIILNQNSLNFQGATSPNPEYDTNATAVTITYVDTTQGWIPTVDDDTSFETPQTPAYLGGRGLTGGGDTNAAAAYTNIIDYVTISTLGNSTDFGDLAGPARDAIDSTSNGTRGMWLGGYQGGATVNNQIDYVTIGSVGNATDFGDLTQARQGPGGCANVTRAITAGGYVNGGGAQNTMDYVTVASIGNATDFGDLTGARWGNHGVASETRACFLGSGVDINYSTIATTGNATDFGDLSRTDDGGCSGNGTRGVMMAGTTIDYITIATPGNATDFGDLTENRIAGGGCGDGIKGLFHGGTVSGTTSNAIDYITIATTGNSADFGDMTTTRYSLQSCSGS